MGNIITGYDAIEYAAKDDLRLSKYADPTEGAREGLSVDEAFEIAAEDPNLIYLPASDRTVAVYSSDLLDVVKSLAANRIDYPSEDDLEPHRDVLKQVMQALRSVEPDAGRRANIVSAAMAFLARYADNPLYSVGETKIIMADPQWHYLKSL